MTKKQKIKDIRDKLEEFKRHVGAPARYVEKLFPKRSQKRQHGRSGF